MNRSVLVCLFGVTSFLLLVTSPSVAQEGVCCFPDCSCILMTEEECDSQGGVWYGEGYDSCDPNPCDCPPCACCFPDGSCYETDWYSCSAMGGDCFGTFCYPNPCPQSGACCFEDCSCQEISEADCFAFGGVLWMQGTDCDPNPCGCPPAACCFPDGQCLIVTEDECIGMGGEIDPSGTCDPNPCPQPIGACCDHCCDCLEMPEEECYALGGIVWMGAGTDCDPNPCTSCPPGECCFPDGTCARLGECSCIEWGGDFLGFGGWCDPNPCPEAGACCYVDGTCVMMTFEHCLALEPEGACTWVNADTCDPNPCPACPTIACCLPDGTCQIYCEYGACEADGGEPMGCFCENHPCPRTGACCLATGACVVRTPTACELVNGEYIGHEVPCEPDPCGTTGVPETSTETTTWGRIKSTYK